MVAIAMKMEQKTVPTLPLLTGSTRFDTKGDGAGAAGISERSPVGRGGAAMIATSLGRQKQEEEGRGWRNDEMGERAGRLRG